MEITTCQAPLAPPRSAFIFLCPLTSPRNTALESWTNDNGLPQNTVRSIPQTRDGLPVADDIRRARAF